MVNVAILCDDSDRTDNACKVEAGIEPTTDNVWAVVENNDIHRSNGAGIVFTDTSSAVQVSKNIIHHNTLAGVIIEDSSDLV